MLVEVESSSTLLATKLKGRGDLILDRLRFLFSTYIVRVEGAGVVYPYRGRLLHTIRVTRHVRVPCREGTPSNFTMF
jgi:hypothetical protein